MWTWCKKGNGNFETTFFPLSTVQWKSDFCCCTPVELVTRAMASIKGVLTMTVGHNRMDNQERGGWCLAENFDPNRPNPLISTQSTLWFSEFYNISPSNACSHSPDGLQTQMAKRHIQCETCEQFDGKSSA
ncbi:Follitropin subunit beta [Trichinella spiralis]|uniref:Follitropin subunit beta n=1 Tax=Trichinella spiralis TaxID=6334 RepID=A0ABR3KER6_TRISP